MASLLQRGHNEQAQYFFFCKPWFVKGITTSEKKYLKLNYEIREKNRDRKKTWRKRVLSDQLCWVSNMGQSNLLNCNLKEKFFEKLYRSKNPVSLD